MVLIICEQGDVISLNFNPSHSHEPAGRHYGVVISPWEVNRISALTLVAPVTSTNNHFPLHVKIRKGNCIDGFVQCEAICAIDLDVREQNGAAEHIGVIDDATMQDIISRVLVVVGAD